MKTSDRGLEAITAHEGLRLRIYKDAAGLDTIGVGHLLTPEDKRSGRFRDGITRQAAMDLLRDDIKIAEKAVNDAVRVPLEQHEFDALVSFVFNVGTGAFRSSTLLDFLNDGGYDEVPAQLARWNKAGGRPVSGLTKRRAAEARMWNGSYDRSIAMRAHRLVETTKQEPRFLIVPLAVAAVIGLAVWTKKNPAAVERGVQWAKGWLPAMSDEKYREYERVAKDVGL